MGSTHVPLAQARAEQAPQCGKSEAGPVRTALACFGRHFEGFRVGESGLPKIS